MAPPRKRTPSRIQTDSGFMPWVGARGRRAAPQSRIGWDCPALTRSRRSLPGLKCGTYLPASATASPVFGLRPWRGGRKCSEKLPKPRISMRSPPASASLMISSMCFTASSMSLAGRCFCFAEMISINSDFVIAPVLNCESPPPSPAATRTGLLTGDLLLQQVAERRAGRRIGAAVLLHRLGFLLGLARADRQRYRAALAVDAHEARFDLVAHLEHGARVLDALTRKLGGAQAALDAVAKVDDRAARVHFLDGALDDAALRVIGLVRRNRVLGELLDAERDSLALRVDRQHHGLDRLALLVVAHRLLARTVPGDVGEVHEAVDAAREPDEDAEVGDRLDLPGHLVAAVEAVGELAPRVRLALLEAERNAAALLVDVEDHHLDLLADVYDLGGVYVLVGPVHLGDVD